MVADFLTSHQDDKDSGLYQELEAEMKAAAASVYIGGHLMRACCYWYILTGPHSIAGAETVRHDNIRNRSHDLMPLVFLGVTHFHSRHDPLSRSSREGSSRN
jgi:hypothetical protein